MEIDQLVHKAITDENSMEIDQLVHQAIIAENESTKEIQNDYIGKAPIEGKKADSKPKVNARKFTSPVAA